MSDLTTSPEIIADRPALERLVERLNCEALLAFDLEADSMHHYTEKVCLIQVSTSAESVLIDPLAFADLSPLAPVLASTAIRKVFHGADYDIRSLHRDFALEVNNLFDTMIACQFLGEKEFGLAAVLKKRFGAELDKKYQRADWSKRPLDREMIAYAVTDTTLLIDLYRQLKSELEERGRLAWVEEECALLSRVRMVDRENLPLFIRFKGASRLDSRTLAVLEELLRFRDEKARQRDVPPFKIVLNETLRELAERKPRNVAELQGTTGLSERLAERHGREILAAVSRGSALAESELPRYPERRRDKRDRRAEDRLQRLKLWREKTAKKLGIDPGVLANNALLETLADQVPPDAAALETIAGMKMWQRREFGAELLALLG